MCAWHGKVLNAKETIVPIMIVFVSNSYVAWHSLGSILDLAVIWFNLKFWI